MSKVAQWGVYLAEFPFAESQSSKFRPVIALSQPRGVHNLIVAIPISTRPKIESVDSVLKDWQECGLLKSSVARTHRLTTLMQSNLKSQLGVLSAYDEQQIKSALLELFQLAA